MAKFTPGPWKIRHLFNVFKDNMTIATCGGYSTNSPQDADRILEEQISNARLIAAAPDAVNELKKCRQAFIDLTPFTNDEGDLMNERLEALEKLLKKIDGEGA